MFTPMKKWSLSFDYQHWLILAGSTVGGAILGYLESQQPGNILTAMTSWATFQPMLHGMMLVGLASLLALAKQHAPPTVPVADTVAAKILMTFAVLGLATIAVGNSGCAALKHDAPAIIPAIDCTALVIEDAIAGLGIAEILAKDGPACQLDAEKVIAVLGKASKVHETTAYRQAASGWKPERP